MLKSIYFKIYKTVFTIIIKRYSRVLHILGKCLAYIRPVMTKLNFNL